MKEDKGVLITIIVLLVIFLPLTILGYIEHDKMENNYDHKLYYQGYLWFYDNDKLIGKYKCNSKFAKSPINISLSFFLFFNMILLPALVFHMRIFHFLESTALDFFYGDSIAVANQLFSSTIWAERFLFWRINFHCSITVFTFHIHYSSRVFYLICIYVYFSLKLHFACSQRLFEAGNFNKNYVVEYRMKWYHISENKKVNNRIEIINRG